MLAAAFVWGLAFYFQKTAMFHIGPLLFVGLRGFIAALVLIPFAYFEKPLGATANAHLLRLAFLAGIVFFLASTVQQIGITTTTVTNTGLLTALYVVALPFLYWLHKRTKPSFDIWVGVVLAFAGVWALSGGTIAPFSQGDWLVAGAAVIWATLMMITSQAGALKRPLTYTCIQFSIVGCLGLVLAFLFEPVNLTMIMDAGVDIIYVGVLSSALTFGVMAVALQHVAPTRAIIILSSETLVSVAAGYLLLDEQLELLGWLGAALIVSAVVYIRLRDA